MPRSATPSAERPITNADCIAWHTNPYRNPHTGREITYNGPTYQRFLHACGTSPILLERNGILPRRDRERRRLVEIHGEQYVNELENRILTRNPSLRQNTAVTPDATPAATPVITAAPTQATPTPAPTPTPTPVVGTDRTPTNSRNRPITDDDCIRFHMNPSINPLTGRQIELFSRTYIGLANSCGHPPSILMEYSMILILKAADRVRFVRLYGEDFVSDFERQLEARRQQIRQQREQNPNGPPIPIPVVILPRTPAAPAAPAAQATATTPSRSSTNSRNRTITDADCRAWHANRFTNPHTDRTIGYFSPIYERLYGACGSPPSELESRRILPGQDWDRRRLVQLYGESYVSELESRIRTLQGVPATVTVPEIQNVQGLEGVSKMSKYEVERFIARRQLLGLQSYIHPVRLTLIDDFEDTIALRNICRQFNVPFQRDRNIPNVFFDIQGTRFSLTTVDRVLHGIRMNKEIIDPITRRIIHRNFDPNSLYYRYVSIGLQYGLDLDHIVPRTSANEPVLLPSEPPSGSHAYYVRMNAIYKDLYPKKSIYSNISSISKSKSVSSSSPEVEENINRDCSELLSGFKENFQKFGNKLKKMCTKYSKKCDNLNEIKTKLLDEGRRIRQAEVTYFLNVNPEYVLATIFRQWLNSNDKNRYMLFTPDKILARYIEQGGIGQGVGKSLIQRMIDELTIYNVFISSQGEETNRYFINPMFKPDESFKRISGVHFDNEEDYVVFYRFIGHLFTLVAINDIGLNIKLSHSILAHMLYKHEEIHEDDYVSYTIMDFPTEFKTYANLMRNPEWIEASDLTFNNVYPLLKKNKQITINNFIQFLRESSKYRYLCRPFSEDIQPKAPNIKQRFLGMVKGMHTIRKFLQKEMITIPTLDKIITSVEISNKIIEELISNINLHLSYDNQFIKPIMESILRDNGNTFPFDVIDMVRPGTAKERKKEFLKFVEKLLMFWASYRKYSPNLNYKISIFTPAEGKEEILPKSHTCFATIDIPRSYALNRDKLYRKLVQATNFVEMGIGNYGGGTKDKKRKQK